jgi:hypothetical protein
VTKWLVKIHSICVESGQNSGSGKNCPNVNIKAHFVSSKHQHQTTFETIFHKPCFEMPIYLKMKKIVCAKSCIQYNIYSFGNPASLGNAAIIKSTNSCSTLPFPL